MSPSSTIDNDKHLLNLVNSICNKYGDDILFIGDFNFPKISWNNSTPKEENATKNASDLFVKCVDNFLIQNINVPTRIIENQHNNILDLVLTNGDFIKNVAISDLIGNSDHVLLQFYYALADSNNISKNFLYYYNKGDYNNLRQYITINLQDINIDNDIESTWTQFKQIIHDGINIYIPKIQLSIQLLASNSCKNIDVMIWIYRTHVLRSLSF